MARCGEVGGPHALWVGPHKSESARPMNDRRVEGTVYPGAGFAPSGASSLGPLIITGPTSPTAWQQTTKHFSAANVLLDDKLPRDATFNWHGTFHLQLRFCLTSIHAHLTRTSRASYSAIDPPRPNNDLASQTFTHDRRVPSHPASDLTLTSLFRARSASRIHPTYTTGYLVQPLAQSSPSTHCG